MSKQLNCNPKLKEFRDARSRLQRDYGLPTHPFHVRYPGYPKFKEFIEHINAKDFFPRQSNTHFVRIKEFILPKDFLGAEKYFGNGPEEAEKTIRVDTFATLVEMIIHLNGQKRFATDMEGGAISGYRGNHPALIQFSTVSHDFYVQPLMIWEHLDVLRPVMENPDIIKIMFGCQNDLLWWRRYFDMDPFPVVDVQAVYQAMNGGNPIKLSRFVESYLPGAKMDKSLTNFDWARRNLPEEAIRYAMEDSRLLLQAWFNYTMHIEKGEDKSEESQNAFNAKMVEIQGALIRVMITGSKPFRPSKSPMPDKLKISQLKKSQEYFYALWNWRDDLARKRDLSPNDILYDSDIVDQANNFPGFEALPTQFLYRNRFLNPADIEELRKLVNSVTNDRVIPSSSNSTTAKEDDNELDALDLQLHADVEGLAELEIAPKANGQIVDRADDWEDWDEPMDIEPTPSQTDAKTKSRMDVITDPMANGQVVDRASDSDDWDEMDVDVYMKVENNETKSAMLIENVRTPSPQKVTPRPKPTMKSVVTVVQHKKEPEVTSAEILREVADQNDGERRVKVQETTTSNEVVIEQATPAIIEPVVTFKDQFPSENRKRIVEYSEEINWAKREQDMRSERIVCTIVHEPLQQPTPISMGIPPLEPVVIVPIEPSAAEQPVPLSPHQPVRPCFICYVRGHVRKICPYFKVPVTSEMKEQFKLNKQQYMNENPEYKNAEMQRKAVNKVMNKARKLDPVHQDVLLHRIQMGRIQKAGGFHGEAIRRR